MCIINPLENSPHRVKCHKIVMIFYIALFYLAFPFLYLFILEVKNIQFLKKKGRKECNYITLTMKTKMTFSFEILHVHICLFIYLITLPLHILQFLAGTPQQHNANYCGPNNRYLTNNDN